MNRRLTWRATRRLSYLGVAVALLGCATQPQKSWHKDGAGPDDFYQDDGQCRAQAFSVAGGNMMQIALVHNSCLRGKGWHLR